MPCGPRDVLPLDAAVAALNAEPGSRAARARLEALLGAGALDGLAGRLVVYGTLAPGRSNHQVVAAIDGRWSAGWVEGDLAEDGWGATEGYPAMRWRPGGARIDVHVLESADLPRHWARLDAFEGPGYRRTSIPLFRSGLPPTVGQVYEARLDRAGNP